MDNILEAKMKTLSSAWKTLADGVYSGDFAEATITLSKDRIMIEGFNYIDSGLHNVGNADGGVSVTDGCNAIAVAPDELIPHGPTFLFQIGSDVILETSRKELEAQRLAEREWQMEKDRGVRTNLLRGASIFIVESGKVIARTEYETHNAYKVRYFSAGGTVERWWNEDALFQDDEAFDRSIAD